MRTYGLKDFPENLRILFDKNYRIFLFSKLWDILRSSTNIARIINVNSASTVRKFKIGKNSRGTDAYIPIWFIKNVSKLLTNKGYKGFLLEEIAKHIIGIKSDSASNPILRPILPLVEDERLIRIYSHLIGDGFGGGKYKRKYGGNFYINPAYTNTSEELIDSFIEDLKVFGKVPYDKRDYGTYWKVIIPFTIKYILENIYQCQISASKGRMPDRFHKLDDKLKLEILRSFCDDEGTIQDNGIVVSSGNKIQLEDLKNIMLSLKFEKKYVSKVKKARDNLYILKFRDKNFLTFGEKIKLFHKEKQKILNFQIERHKNPSNKKSGKNKSKIIKFLNHQPHTSLQLAMKLKISQNTTGQILRQLINTDKVERCRIPGKNQIEYKIKVS